jgi:tol-pal system protein YbgF
LDDFPETELADNAAYWTGECYFSQAKYEQAIREFDDILRVYPRSDKLASALLKKGYAYLELGQREQGVVQLQHVIREYPGTDEANLARQRLSALGVDAG